MNCPFNDFKDWLTINRDGMTFPVKEEDFHELWMEYTLSSNLKSLDMVQFVDGKVKIIGMRVLFEGYRNLNITE